MALKNRWIIAGAIFFVAIQLFYSYLLLNRAGNIPPSPDDSFAYIFYIQRPGLFKSFFPKIISQGINANFEYLSYTLVFGALSWFARIPANLLFYSSFVWGKLILLAVILYLISTLKLKKIQAFFVLMFFAIFAGTGAIHGFFWVVPSFWYMVLLILEIALFFDRKRRPSWTIFLASILAAMMHKLSIPMVFIWIFLVPLTLMKLGDESLPNARRVVVSYIVSVFVFFAVQLCYGWLFIKNYQISTIIPTQYVTSDRIDLSKYDQSIALIPNITRYFPNQLTNGFPFLEAVSKLSDINLKISSLEGFNFIISKFFPPIMVYLHSLVGPFLPIFPLIISVPIAYKFISKKKPFSRYWILTLAATMTSIFFLWHPFGFRTLWITMMLIYGSLGLCMAEAVAKKHIWIFGILIVIWIQIFLFNLSMVWKTAKPDQAFWDTKSCSAYINKYSSNRMGNLFFTNQTGLNAFLATGYGDWVLRPFINRDSIAWYIENKQTILLVRNSENTTGDSNFAKAGWQTIFDLIPDWKSEDFSCGYFTITNLKPSD